MKIVSLFSGCGGLDIGFEKAGYNIIWANEYDKTIHETYLKNFPNTILDKRSIVDIPSSDIPDCDGIIGGPPCQSWSCGGSKKGFNDKRGKTFLEFIRIIKDKQPKFFVAENVKGLLSKSKKPSLDIIINLFHDAGYNVTYKLLKSSDYGVAQDRERVFFIGMRNCKFTFNLNNKDSNKLKDVIFDIKDSVVKSNGWKTNPNVILNAHEYLPEDTNGFSPQYMSRNRVRKWDDYGYTVVCSARHITLHPDSPVMVKVETDKFKFVEGVRYRRLSVRECARIQSFPDTFILYYSRVLDGYKMIGNAVPPHLSHIVATTIKKYTQELIDNFSKEFIILYD